MFKYKVAMRNIKRRHFQGAILEGIRHTAWFEQHTPNTESTPYVRVQLLLVTIVPILLFHCLRETITGAKRLSKVHDVSCFRIEYNTKCIYVSK